MAKRFIGITLIYWILDLLTGIWRFLLRDFDILYNFAYAILPFLPVNEDVYRFIDALYLAIVTYLLFRRIRQ